MPRPSRRRRADVLLLALGLCTSACIKREAAPGGAAPPPPVAAPAAPLPPAPSVAPADVEAFALQGRLELADVKPVGVEAQPFERALEAVVKDLGESEWAVQLQAPTVLAVEQHDVLLATFHARLLEGTDETGRTTFVFEQAQAPYTKSVTYPVTLTREWRKIQVPFTASEAYAAGAAQIVFRLGFSPQTLQIGGVLVQNFGKQVALAALPSSAASDQRLARAAAAPKPITIVEGGDLLFDVRPKEIIRKISPYVYGLNSQLLEGTGATVRRNGGNRGSVYNWENNASNAGKDWHHTSDDWPCTSLGIANCSEPAAQLVGFFEQNRRAGAETVITVPMLDFVAADKSGNVTREQKAPSARFVRTLTKKRGPLSLTPDPRDGVVYQEELVNYLVTKLGKAQNGGVRFYSLDNEPALWSETHPYVHPERTTYAEVVRRSEETAKMITDLDPSAFVLGGVMFGWSEYQSLSSAPDAPEHNREYGTYLEYFLASLKKLEQKHKRRLVHALDVHWYPEARGTERITSEDVSRATIDARLQAPRSLWDKTYVERSWITAETGAPIRLIPWLRETIQKRYPGTELTISEYGFGATEHVSGALAQVDALGVMGREGVYLATYWGSGAGVGKLPSYIAAAFQMYRNYDGKGGAFGDTAVKASVTEDELASVFAATSSKEPSILTVITINKTLDRRFDAIVRIGGKRQYTRAESFVIGPAASALVRGAAPSLQNNVLRHRLEPLTATLFVLRKQ